MTGAPLRARDRHVAQSSPVRTEWRIGRVVNLHSSLISSHESRRAMLAAVEVPASSNIAFSGPRSDAGVTEVADGGSTRGDH